MNTSRVYGERIGCTIESSFQLVDCIKKGRFVRYIYLFIYNIHIYVYIYKYTYLVYIYIYIYILCVSFYVKFIYLFIYIYIYIYICLYDNELWKLIFTWGKIVPLPLSFSLSLQGKETKLYTLERFWRNYHENIYEILLLDFHQMM